VNKLDKPIWVEKYVEIGLPEDWADKVIEKHEEELIFELSSELSPIKYTEVNFNDIENQSLDKFPDPPEKYTFTEVVLLLFDVIYEFSKNIPEEDNEIYSIYKEIEKKNYFDTTPEFSDFYKFCRQIQYNSIKSKTQYRKLDRTYNEYIDVNIPEINTKWIVKFEGSKCKVQVQEQKSNVSDNTIDVKIYGQVVEIIDDPNGEFDLGEFVNLPVNYFIREAE
jgi:hypothetical protein